jgi:hypothetical protein
MLIIGCDFHTRYQQIAMAREETGELLVERRLDHESGEAHAFYRSLQSSQEPVCAGIENNTGRNFKDLEETRGNANVSVSSAQFLCARPLCAPARQSF